MDDVFFVELHASLLSYQMEEWIQRVVVRVEECILLVANDIDWECGSERRRVQGAVLKDVLGSMVGFELRTAHLYWYDGFLEYKLVFVCVAV